MTEPNPYASSAGPGRERAAEERPGATAAESGGDAAASDPPPLRSIHTASFPQLLAEAGSSVLVTTYQAGKLVILRNDGGVLNTHFRNFLKPMGLAIEGRRLAIGASVDILEFHNVPAVCRRLDGAENQRDAGGDWSSAAAGEAPRGARHDACFLPRWSHTTGNVQIHEMAYVDGELWFVNTAFSCLATRSDDNSFTPRWRPWFVPQLMPGDCCHLNGLAVRDGRVRYVTALGDSGEPESWRRNKRDGGVVIDVEANAIVARGLSMPHSPRWYRNRLWLLESGDGSLGSVDLTTGRYEPIVRLPGFTRGLSFLGPLALVGLSQVRETAVFSGIPLVERLAERTCGVWAVHLETGQSLGFVKFQDAVQEIFAVEVLRGSRYPDLINHDLDLIGKSYVLPQEALCDVPGEFRR